MYQIQKSTKYYVYNCNRQVYHYVANSWSDLIEYIAHFNYTKINWYFSPYYSTARSNSLLEDFNCTMQDTKTCYGLFGECLYFLREYIVFDDEFRIIDMRMFKDEILAYERHKNYNRKWQTKALEYKYEKTKPEFRNGPVPNTRKRTRYGKYLRHPKTFNEMKQNGDEEKRKYSRKNRLRLPTSWDEHYRDTSKCWKDQSKKRKQWM